MQPYESLFRDTSHLVVEELSRTLDRIDPAQVQAFVDALLAADKVFVVGVGRVLLALQAMTKRFAHLGIAITYVGAITEPAITPKDLLIVGSGSGPQAGSVAETPRSSTVRASVTTFDG